MLFFSIGSKVASVSHSPPPTTKKPHLHTTMSVPANLTHEGYESKHDSSIVEVSTYFDFFLITDYGRLIKKATLQCSLFSLQSRNFGLGQTNWADKFWGIWGIFG
jgi:hypothetical protein